MPNENRKTVNVKLTPSVDFELIAWWENLPQGKRNSTLKEALRLYAFGSTESPKQRHYADELAEVREQLGYLSDAIQQDKPTSIDPAIVSRVDDLASWVQKIADDLPGYIRDEIARAMNGAPLPAQPTAQEAPQLDTETLNARVDNLRKQKNRW